MSVIAGLGIVFSRYTVLGFSALVLLSVVFLVSSIILSRRRESGLIIAFALFFTFAALHLNSLRQASCDIVNFIFGKNESLLVSGTVISNRGIKSGYLEFILKAREIDAHNLRNSCCGNILVKVKSTAAFSPGENLILSGNLHRAYTKPGGRFDYRKYLYSKNIYSLMDVHSDLGVIRLKNNQISLAGISFWMKNRSRKMINQYLKGYQAAVLEAMVLGEKESLPRKLINSMVLSGTVHILVVSGFNVGIVCFIAVLLLKIFRLPRKLRLVITSVLLLFYCLITGSSIPVVRATIMAEIFLWAYFFKRETDIYNTLALASLIILLISPGQLFDPGFQLSFISVFCICFFFPLFKNKLRLEKIKSKIILFFLDGALVSFSAWLGTCGVIAFNFRIFSPVTVVANIFIVPLASVITLCGFGIIIFGSVFGVLAKLFAANAEVLVTALFIINNFLIKIPGAYLKF